MKRVYLFGVLSFFLSFSTAFAQIVYVTPAGSGAMDGSSWSNALDGNGAVGNGYTRLADTMRLANSGTHFWIAEGIYKPCTDNDREKSFELSQNVKIYGGFLGNETSMADRNWNLHLSILSGDIGVTGVATDNTIHVVTTLGSGWSQFSTLDGLVIRDGYAFDPLTPFTSPVRTGAGIYASNKLQLQNCTITGNSCQQSGGGILSSGILNINNCIFTFNTASSGAAIAVRSSSTFNISCSKIVQNTSSYSGGGITTDGISKITNCLITNNSASNGGGILIMGSNTTISSSTIANNGLGVFVWASSSGIIRNSIISGGSIGLMSVSSSVDCKYTCVEGNIVGEGNINQNPLFVSPTLVNGPSGNGLAANWRLRWCSPCFEAGNNTMIPPDVATDIEGNTRIRYSAVDMGAYELDTTGLIQISVDFTNNTIYVSDSSNYSGDGSTWQNALAGNMESCKYPGQSVLYETMKDAINGTEIWIKKGIYKNSLLGNRNHSFTVGNGVIVYGGFLGNESSPSQRNLQINKTIFSGNIGDTLLSTDNSIHVLNINPTGEAYTDSARIDGVTVADGYANGADGAGILINPNTKIRCNNLEIKNNTSSGNGAGMKINALAGVRITNSLVANNTGVGIYNLGKILLDSCSLKLNSTTGVYSADSLFINYCSIDSNLTSGIINAAYCKITDGSLKGNKSGIWNKPGATFYLNNCNVSGNATGGGILNNGSLVITGSTINYNSVNSSGSGINNSATATCSVSHSTLAYNGGGGAVNYGVFNIECSSICNNTGGYGGGLYNPTIVKNCIVANNTKSSVYTSGGGIWVGSGCQGVFNTTVANNTGEGISSSTMNGWGGLIINPEIFLIKNSIIYGNETQLSGNFNISNSCSAGIEQSNSNIFDDPQWINPSIGIGTAFSGVLADWSLQNCSPCVNNGNNTFLSPSDTTDALGNTRLMYGVVDMGGVESQVPPVNDILYEGGIVYINDSANEEGNGTSWSNSAPGNAPSCKYMGYNMLYQAMRDAPAGYQVWIKGGFFKVSNDDDRNKSFLIEPKLQVYGGFAGNENTLSQRNPSSNQTILSGNIGIITDSLDNSYHVMISLASPTIWNDTALLDNITIQDGMADGAADKICGGGILLNTNCRLKMTYCKIISNSCLGRGNPNIPTYTGGGGIMNKGILMMENCEVSKNKAVYLGGGIFSNCDLSLKNCLIDGNKITFPGGGWFPQWGGGGIYNYITGNLTVDSCTIKNNTTQNNLHAGGIYNKGRLELERSTIEGNFSGRDGGGMYSMGPTSINHCHFTNNQSAFYGGAIVATDTLKIDSCLFDYNIGCSQPTIVTSGVSIISNSELSHSIMTCQAGRAGGIFSNGKTRVINCNIHSHDTHGIQLEGSGGMFNIVIIFTDSDGGGIQHQGDTLWVENCNIHHNIAGGGGGIAVYSGVAYVLDTKIVNNFTAVGAAIRNKAKVYVSNCLIANNSYYNGGLFQNVSNSNMEIINSTISNNMSLSTANDNALLYHGEYQNYTENQFQFTNCIIQSQSSLTGFYPGSAGSELINYSNVTGGFPGIGNINSDPLFVNPTAGIDTTTNALLADWSLSACSPCINIGNDTVVSDTLDLGGNVRKFNRVDMGAYELQYLNTIANVNASQIGRTNALVVWETSILPCRTAVFVKDTIAGQPAIDNVGLYSPNIQFGSGSQIDGWFCVYNDINDSVAITGLVEGTKYRVAVFNYVLNQFYDAPVFLNFITEKTELPDITKIFGEASFLLSASAVSGINSFEYTIDNPSVASVAGNLVTINGCGLAQIKARHNGNNIYLSDSTTAVLTINFYLPDPESISGPSVVYQGQNQITYSIPEITYATSYIWTLPTGATGTSSTNSIDVDFGLSAISGNITVMGTNDCGDGAVSTLAITVNAMPFTQIVHIPKGWSGLSSYVDPENPDIIALLESIEDAIVILYNYEGMYFPAQNINTVQEWNAQSGYFIKTQNEIDLTFMGSMVANKTVALETGWNLIPVLNSCEEEVTTLFDGLEVIMIKEVAGLNLYWPQYNINTLPQLQSGKAYLVLMQSPGTITFTDCE